MEQHTTLMFALGDVLGDSCLECKTQLELLMTVLLLNVSEPRDDSGMPEFRLV